MLKPNWKRAPEWAQYCAQDFDGDWAWYEFKPAFNETYDTWYAPGNGRALYLDDADLIGTKESRLLRRP